MSLICVSSPKGGVGKTTIVANLASRLAASGLRVVAIDLDPQNSLRLHFSVPLAERSGFLCMLPHLPDWRKAARRTSSGVLLLAYGRQRLADAMIASATVAARPELLVKPIQEISNDPDTVVIVDTAPGLSPQLMALLPFTDLLLTVLLADPISISQIPNVDGGETYGSAVGTASTSVRSRSDSHHDRIGFVLNQYDVRSRLGPGLVRSASTYLGERLLGVVFRDETVSEAVAAQKCVHEYCAASKAAKDIEQLARTVASRFGGYWSEPARRASA